MRCRTVETSNGRALQLKLTAEDGIIEISLDHSRANFSEGTVSSDSRKLPIGNKATKSISHMLFEDRLRDQIESNSVSTRIPPGILWVQGKADEGRSVPRKKLFLLLLLLPFSCRCCIAMNKWVVRDKEREQEQRTQKCSKLMLHKGELL